jgi:hypothetical protein
VALDNQGDALARKSSIMSGLTDDEDDSRDTIRAMHSRIDQKPKVQVTVYKLCSHGTEC